MAPTLKQFPATCSLLIGQMHSVVAVLAGWIVSVIFCILSSNGLSFLLNVPQNPMYPNPYVFVLFQCANWVGLMLGVYSTALISTTGAASMNILYLGGLCTIMSISLFFTFPKMETWKKALITVVPGPICYFLSRFY
jgi:hypothetical protein